MKTGRPRRLGRGTDDHDAEAGMTIARPLARPARVGDVVGGKYRLVSALGGGSNGRIFLARHLVLETTVALKFMHPHLVHEKASVARFARDARAAATLKSEYAVRIHDVDERASGEPYIVMEYLDGHSLDAIATRGRGLPISVAITYVLQACDALDEAHARGIIHRDVKPANLFLTKDKYGEAMIKVLDFGLAKAITEPGAVVMSGAMHALGTPRYMSPEQIRNERAVDARTDVWSLGATLYELLTARPAFDGPNAVVVFERILQGTTSPVQRLRPDVPDALAAIIERCLMHDAAERFASVAELARALESIAAPEASQPDALACTGSTPVAMTLPDGPERRERPEPTVRQTAVAAMAGPALIALAAAFMAVWTGIGPAAAAGAPGPSPAVVVHVRVKSGGSLRMKDPATTGATERGGRCAKSPRGSSCTGLARN